MAKKNTLSSPWLAADPDGHHVAFLDVGDVNHPLINF
jgi:hypothetical protein